MELGVGELRVELLASQSPNEMVTKILSLHEGTCTKVLMFLWKWWSVQNVVNARERMLGTSEIDHAIGHLVVERSRREKSMASGSESKRQS